VVGGDQDNTNIGAIWIFTRNSTGGWTQQQKLTPTGHVGTTVELGYSVTCSGDGTIIAAGAFLNNANLGATWIFVNNGGTWIQTQILLGTGYTGTPQQGASAACDNVCNTLVVGGTGDNTNQGAVWTFTNHITAIPSVSPSTSVPSKSPSFSPSKSPSTSVPSKNPTTSVPSKSPSKSPTTSVPSKSPSISPTTSIPSKSPTTSVPSKSPSFSPTTSIPSKNPTTSKPSKNPTSSKPSVSPSFSPSTSKPSKNPTSSKPSVSPSFSPSTSKPSKNPTTSKPSKNPTTSVPSKNPSVSPSTSKPSKNPTTSLPSKGPTTSKPTRSPTTSVPSHSPSIGPTTSKPSTSPSTSKPSKNPTTSVPSKNPTTSAPSVSPTGLNYFSQPSSKLTPPPSASGSPQFGNSVSLSSNGNYLAVGSYQDASGVGAVNVYTSSGSGTWTLQTTTKLVGTGGTGAGEQGFSVSVSGDGTTLVVGAPFDTSSAGRIYFYTRSGTTWTQQQAITYASGAKGGWSTALSQNGSIVIVGAPLYTSSAGTTIVYVLSGGTWTGSLYTGTGATGTVSEQGFSVAVTPTGNIFMTCGYADNSDIGACWIYQLSGPGVWTQQQKIVPTGSVGSFVYFGYSCALSTDGNTAIVGGAYDSSSIGAVWIFIQAAGVVRFLKKNSRDNTNVFTVDTTTKNNPHRIYR